MKIIIYLISLVIFLSGCLKKQIKEDMTLIEYYGTVNISGVILNSSIVGIKDIEFLKNMSDKEVLGPYDESDSDDLEGLSSNKAVEYITNVKSVFDGDSIYIVTKYNFREHILNSIDIYCEFTCRDSTKSPKLINSYFGLDFLNQYNKEGRFYYFTKNGLKYIFSSHKGIQLNDYRCEISVSKDSKK